MSTETLRPAPSVGQIVRPVHLGSDAAPYSFGCVARVSIDTVTMDDGRLFSRWDTEFLPVTISPMRTQPDGLRISFSRSATPPENEGPEEVVGPLPADLAAMPCPFCDEDHRTPAAIVASDWSPGWRWTARGQRLIGALHSLGWFTAGALVSQWIIR